MAITYTLAPEPFWTIINSVGTTAGGAIMTTLDQDTRLPRSVFMDPNGDAAWTNPIIFGLNGVQGPFYFQFDSSNPDDQGYFLSVTDAQGVELWTIENFTGGGGGGGGGTTVLPLKNYISNNQFIDHIDNTAAMSTVASNLVIAPDNHKGFTPALINPVIGVYGAVGPDIRYLRTTSPSVPPTDQITFVTFDLADEAFFPNDVTPVEYVHYSCTGAATGETFKCFQFPITQKVKNLSNQQMTFMIWAKVTTTPVNITLYTRQYCGSSPTATPESVVTRQQQGSPITLTTTWTPYLIQFVMPDVAAYSLGTPGAQTDDDAVYLQLQMPLNSTCEVSFVKPKLYLGTIPLSSEFQDYDDINSINSTPRTGDIRTSLSSAAPNGWVAMNDGSIGNVGSGATTRANQDTFQLYKTLWDGVSNTYAPVSTGRGASAIADFLANKTLTLPLSLGRALANAGTGPGPATFVLGQNAGEQQHTLTIAEMPSHSHTPSSNVQAFLVNANAGFSIAGSGSIAQQSTTGSTGGGSAHNIIQPTTFFNVFIKL